MHKQNSAEHVHEIGTLVVEPVCVNRCVRMYENKESLKHSLMLHLCSTILLNVHVLVIHDPELYAKRIFDAIEALRSVRLYSALFGKWCEM